MQPRISLFNAPAHKVRSYVRSLAQKERALSVRMLRALHVVERRRLYHPFPSLYEYCRGELKMSEAVAYTRSRLARTAQRYPRILPALRDGRLNLSGLLILNKYLRPEHAEELLREAEGKSNQEIKELLARSFPQPDVPTIIVPLAPVSASDEPAMPRENVCADNFTSEVTHSQSVGILNCAQPLPTAPGLVFTEDPRARVEPLAPGRYSFHLTIPSSTLLKLRYAQELLRHAVAAGDVAAVMDRALDALIAELEKKTIGSTENPRPHAPIANNQHIPLAVQAEVITRDGWRCSFPMPDGGVCGSRWRLQFHHLVSVAKGGQSVAKNLVLRCAAHHRHETEAEFGLPFVEGKIERRQRMNTQARSPS
jgi:hypothetical protein